MLVPLDVLNQPTPESQLNPCQPALIKLVYPQTKSIAFHPHRGENSHPSHQQLVLSLPDFIVIAIDNCVVDQWVQFCGNRGQTEALFDRIKRQN